MPPEATRWLERNGPSLVGIRQSPLPEQPWGLTAVQPGEAGERPRLLLYVFDWHASGNIVVYGLTGGVSKAYLGSDPNHTGLTVSRLNRSLVIAGPRQAPDPIATVVVLEQAEKLETEPPLVRPAGDGTILLHARDAIVHGRTVRYEPDPHKDTVGYWTDARDWVSWEFEVQHPGVYRAEILQGCGKGSGGSTVDFAVGEQVLHITVQDTGGFQNFVARDAGAFRLDRPGRYTLAVKPTHKPGLAVMDLRRVTLTPKASGG